MDIQFEIANKKRAAVFLILIVVGILFIISGLFSSSPPRKEISPIQTSPPIQAQEQQKEDQSMKDAYQTVAMGDISQNPFIEISKLPKVGNDIPVQQSPSLQNLPAIPSPNVPVDMPLPVIPGGSMPVPASVAPPVPERNSSVQGVLTGGNGNNMAIMSDGRVVQAGDTYNDSRIAYIGGDGITFDDGHKIDYK